MEKTSPKEEDEDNREGEIMDSNWILLKLDKGAIGKRVEVHQPSNNSWWVNLFFSINIHIYIYYLFFLGNY